MASLSTVFQYYLQKHGKDQDRNQRIWKNWSIGGQSGFAKRRC